MKIKVCGMCNPDNILSLGMLKPDYMGFIFYRDSKRYAKDLDKGIIAKLPLGIKKTGVFVNAGIDEIRKIISIYQLDAVQLHGTENADVCKTVKDNGVEVIKAFGIDDKFDFQRLLPYVGATDYFLFDTKTIQYGGSGQVFNWDILKQYSLDKPYFLSGGLSLENLSRIKQLADSRLYAVDMNSKFEIQPGVKDIYKIKQAINLIRN